MHPHADPPTDPHALCRRIGKFADERPVRIGPAIHFIFRCFPMTCVYDDGARRVSILCPLPEDEAATPSGPGPLFQPPEGSPGETYGVERRGGRLVARTAADSREVFRDGGLERLVNRSLDYALVLGSDFEEARSPSLRKCAGE